MIDATGLRGVVGDGAAWAAELVVEADAGGEREEAGRDAREQVSGVRAPWRSSESRFLQVQKTDSIRCRMVARCTPCRARCGERADERRSERSDLARELATGVALVADDRLSASKRLGEDAKCDLALGTVGADERR